MGAIITLTSEDMDNDDLHALTRELANAINNESSQVNASLAEERAGTGVKGDPVTIGTIILTFLGAGGVAVKLVELLKAYVERPNRLRVQIKNENGESVEIDGDNLDPQQIDKVTSMLKKMIGE